MSEDIGVSSTPGATEVRPEDVDFLLKQDLQNLRSKVLNGGTLTEAQIKRLEASQASASPALQPDAVYVTTQQALAEALGVADRKTIQRWLKDGAPAATDDGRYNVTEWRLWMQSKNRGSRKAKDDPENIKTQIALVELRRKEIELEELRGHMIDSEEAFDVSAEMWTRFAQAFRALKHELAPSVVGETVPEATKRIGAAFDHLLNSLSVPEGAKKKAFWRNVSARLSDLRQTFLRSNMPEGTSSCITAGIPTRT